MLMLVVATAMVLDFGLIRYDRQRMKLAADNAVMSGLRAADGGTGDVYTWAGVCGALEFLRNNEPGLGSLTSGPCTTPDTGAICDPSNPTANKAEYSDTVTVGGRKLWVSIKSPYLTTDPGFTSDGAFPEESYASLTTDTTKMNGCDQLGIIIKEARTPGLGSLAKSANLVTRVRSVGRVDVGPGDRAPALLLLERTKCGVLTVGSAGSPSRISVAASATMPGTIHSDSTATDSGCGSGSNQQLFQGKQTNGVVAYGTGTLSGLITSVASANGTAANIIADDPTYVYGTTAVYPATGGTVTPVSPRRQVTRKLIDKRYLNGVTSIVTGAYTQWLLDHSSPAGYPTRVDCPPGSPAGMATYMSTLASMTAGQSLYIDCPVNAGITLDGSIGAGTVYIHGFIKNGNLALPNASRVYIDDTDNAGNRINASAIALGNGNTFCVRATAANCNASTPTIGRCSDAPTGVPGAKAQLVIRRGQMDSSGGSSPGLLRLCNTTVILAGGQLGGGSSTNPGGCLPTTWGTAPTATPCVGASTSAGTSPISLSGLTDWTAPNAYGDMSAPPASLDDAGKQAMWDGGEDLALWTETYGDGPTFKMAGGGNLHVAGVFMVPNAFPFTITGSGIQDLTNAQYITRAFAVDGGATLKMAVDPYNAVPLPTLNPFTLVR